MWNVVKASIRTFNPAEQKYIFQDPKFNKQVAIFGTLLHYKSTLQAMIRHVNRIRAFVMVFKELGEFMQSLFSWDSPLRSTIGFIVSVVL